MRIQSVVRGPLLFKEQTKLTKKVPTVVRGPLLFKEQTKLMRIQTVAAVLCILKSKPS